MSSQIDLHFSTLSRLITQTECTVTSGVPIRMSRGLELSQDLARRTAAAGNRLFFIGNGGSAGIASHMAIDFSKNGGMPALSLNDGAALTCIGNDLGYERVFAQQIEWHAREGDTVVAISSSGKSPNMVRATEAARAKGCSLVTFTGFAEDNPLRAAGDINFYVRSHHYGLVEVAHLSLCHALLDVDMAWGRDSGEQLISA